MPNALAATNLVALDKALEAAGAAITLVMRAPAPLKPIADQVIRSASSVPADLAEGHGRSGRDRAHLWRIAYASATEVDSHFWLLVRAGVVDDVRAEEAIETFDEVRAMTWRLLHPRREEWPPAVPNGHCRCSLSLPPWPVNCCLLAAAAPFRGL